MLHETLAGVKCGMAAITIELPEEDLLYLNQWVVRRGVTVEEWCAGLVSDLRRSSLVSQEDSAEDPGIEAAWDREIRERIAAYDAGQVRSIPAAEVFRSLTPDASAA